MKVNFPFSFPVLHVGEKFFIIQQTVLVFVVGINDILQGIWNEWMNQIIHSDDQILGNKSLTLMHITWTFPSLERIPCFFISLWSSCTDTNPSLFWSSFVKSPRNWSMTHSDLKLSAILLLYKKISLSCVASPLWAGKQCICNIQRSETCMESCHAESHWQSSEPVVDCSVYNGSLLKRHLISSRKTADGAMAAKPRICQVF